MISLLGRGGGGEPGPSAQAPWPRNLGSPARLPRGGERQGQGFRSRAKVYSEGAGPLTSTDRDPVTVRRVAPSASAPPAFALRLR